MAKRLSNESTIGAVLSEIIQVNKLQGGIDDVAVKEAWKNLMGNGVNTYTKNVLLKGGHLKSTTITSLLFMEDGTVHDYHFEKYNTVNTHGSGCTLSSAIASYLAQGHALVSAVTKAQDYVQKAIYKPKGIPLALKV